jgi:hypothetical protein
MGDAVSILLAFLINLNQLAVLRNNRSNFLHSKIFLLYVYEAEFSKEFTMHHFERIQWPLADCLFLF